MCFVCRGRIINLVSVALSVFLLSIIWPLKADGEAGGAVSTVGERDSVWEEWILEQGFSKWANASIDEVREWVLKEELKIKRLEEESWRDAFIARKRLVRRIENRLTDIVGVGAVDDLVVEDVLVTVRPPVLFSGKAVASELFRTDLKDGPGQLSSRSQLVSFGASIFPSDGVMLSLKLSAGTVDYSFDRANSLDPVFGDPIDNSSSLKASLILRWRVTREWSAIMTLSAQGSSEDQDDFEDGITYLGIFGASYRVSKSLQLGLGLFAQTRLEEDPRAFPIPIIRWTLRFSEDWTLFFGLPDGLKLNYSINDKLTISAKIGSRGALNLQDTRLNNNDFAPRGVLRQTLVPVSLGFNWKILPILVLEAETGVIVFQRLEIDDRRGRNLTEDQVKPQPFLSFNLSFRF
ncbi:MAG: DUF6268 family outer membrane beta-barrel protein [Planctomycetota bacterium]|nr:DUF6268 family outer membrane beta-barrel protein [Planctomycetota bacterium]